MNIDEMLDKMTDEDIVELTQTLGSIVRNTNLTDQEKLDIIDNGDWKQDWWYKPPTPEEFLTEEWLGDLANDIFDYWRPIFYNYFKGEKEKELDPYNKYLTTYLPIGTGKTTFLVLLKVYMGVIFTLLKDPIAYFRKNGAKIASNTVFVDMSVSFSKLQCEDLIMKPIKQVLMCSPKFVKIKFKEEFDNLLKTGQVDKIPYNTIGDGGSLLQIGHLHYNTASEPSQLLGLNIISGSVTEAAFLAEVMGEEKVMRIYHDLDKRIESRFPKVKNRYAKLILDSSPNTLTGLMDQFIEKHKNDRDNLYLAGTKWEYQPWLFPIWQSDPEIHKFWIFTGTAEQEARIIDPDEIKNFDPERVMWCPEDIRESIEEDINKTIRDWCGKPTAGTDNALIKDGQAIIDVFEDCLNNEIGYMFLSSKDDPRQLIWNKVKEKYWCGNTGSYYLRRNQLAERFVAVDLSEKHDMACLTMLHNEGGPDGEKMYIVDFNICVLAKSNDPINIDAFWHFIVDMKTLGHVNIKHVAYDGFQSSSSIQCLNRVEGIKAEKLALDNNIEDYMAFASYVYQHRIKAGKSIVFKNNLFSLIKGNTRNGKELKKMTVDHCQGDWVDLEKIRPEDWETSKCGYYGKDCSDSCANAVALADRYGKFNSFEYIWDIDLERRMYEFTEQQLVLFYEEKEGWIERSWFEKDFEKDLTYF